MSARAQLVDVLEHDHAGLHGDPEQRQKANAGGDAEVSVRYQQRQQAADPGHGDGGKNHQRPLDRLVHRIQDDEDEQHS